MANLCDTCGDSQWDLLLKILAIERDSFDRLQQLIDVTAAGGGGGGGGNVNVSQIGGTNQSGADVVDVANTALRVNVVAGGGAGGTSSTFGVAVPGTGTAAGFSDGTNMQMARVFDADSGAGTQYVLGSILRASASGGSVETGVAGNPIRTDPTGTTTQPISAAALPLPTGASTAANQATEIASLASIDAGIPAALGQTTMAASMPVVIASNQSAIPVSGTITATPTGTQDVNLIQIAGTAASVNNGTSDAGTLRVTVSSNSTGNIATIGTSVTPGTAAGNLGKAEDAAHVSGDTGVAAWGVANEAQTTLAADGDYIAHATDLKGNKLVVGNLAHDAVDAGFPVKIGFQGRTTLPTAVSDADRTNGISDKFGRQIVNHAIRDLRGNQQTTITSSTSETTIITADASNMLDLYGLIVTNTSATACKVTIKDSTAGTTRIVIEVPATETRGFMLPSCDGHKQNAANNNWTATCGTSVASIEITALFNKNPS